jgi:hypothetical protein
MAPGVGGTNRGRHHQPQSNAANRKERKRKILVFLPSCSWKVFFFVFFFRLFSGTRVAAEILVKLASSSSSSLSLIFSRRSSRFSL